MAKIDLLTAAKVKALKGPGDYLDGRGLYLQVRNETSKSWLLKYSLDKKAREMGLGSAFDITLAKARDLRDGYRSLLAQDIDPIDAKKAEGAARALERAKAITFKAAAERYINANLSGWKNIKHADQYRMTLLGLDPKGKPAENDYCKLIRDLPVAAIDTTLVIKVLEPIWSTKNETAGRLRGRIESVISACKARGEFTGENPARWKGHLDQLLPKPSKVKKVQKRPALPCAELPAFMKELRARDAIAAAALEFQILTAVRPGNAVGARWAEIDRNAAVWRIEGKHMKNGEDHNIPLSAAAFAVLDRMEKIKAGEHIFYSPTNGRALSDAALAAVIDRMNEKSRRWIDSKLDREIVPHGFRSTFRDWAAERGYPDAVAEAALAHSVPDEVVAAYKRTTFFDLRKKMMADWATFAMSDPARSADVIQMPAHATAG
jgi:integrase